jgi:hypothetical protein
MILTNFLIGFLLFFSLIPSFDISQKLEPYQFPQSADTAVIFSGQQIKIAYQSDRKLTDATFAIKNNTRQKLKITLVNVILLRGNSQEILTNYKFKSTSKGPSDFLIINSGSLQKIRILFKPFVIYEGSKYTIKAIISADGKNYEAVTTFETFRHAVGDKNKYKH